MTIHRSPKEDPEVNDLAEFIGRQLQAGHEYRTSSDESGQVILLNRTTGRRFKIEIHEIL